MTHQGLDIQAKLGNYYFCCAVCEDWKDATKVPVRFFSNLKQLQPLGNDVQAAGPAGMRMPDNFAPLFTPSPVCVSCFKKLDMKEQGPDKDPKIILPNVMEKVANDKSN